MLDWAIPLGSAVAGGIVAAAASIWATQKSHSRSSNREIAMTYSGFYFEIIGIINYANRSLEKNIPYTECKMIDSAGRRALCEFYSANSDKLYLLEICSVELIQSFYINFISLRGKDIGDGSAVYQSEDIEECVKLASSAAESLKGGVYAGYNR